MDGFVDLQDAIKSESKSRLNRVEKLASFSALILLGAAVWLAWPTLKSGMVGNSLNSDLMYAFIIIAWGVFVQDLGIMDKKSRSRIGIIATVAWLPLAVIALSYFEGDISELLGMSILLIVSYALFFTSRQILRGDVAVMKFRSVMGVLGFVLSASLLTTINFDDISEYLQAGICAVGLFLVQPWLFYQ